MDSTYQFQIHQNPTQQNYPYKTQNNPHHTFNNEAQGNIRPIYMNSTQHNLSYKDGNNYESFNNTATTTQVFSHQIFENQSQQEVDHHIDDNRHSSLHMNSTSQETIHPSEPQNSTSDNNGTGEKLLVQNNNTPQLDSKVTTTKKLKKRIIRNKKDENKEKKDSGPNLKSRALNKQLRREGKPYIGITRKDREAVFKPGRILGETCKSIKCKNAKSRRCQEIFEEHRKMLFNNYWSHMTCDEKREYVLKYIDIILPKRRCTTEGESRRTFTLNYFLPVNRDKYPVCKHMFLSTLGIKDATVRHWICHKTTVNLSEFFEEQDEDKEVEVNDEQQNQIENDVANNEVQEELQETNKSVLSLNEAIKQLKNKGIQCIERSKESNEYVLKVKRPTQSVQKSDVVTSTETTTAITITKESSDIIVNEENEKIKNPVTEKCKKKKTRILKPCPKMKKPCYTKSNFCADKGRKCHEFSKEKRQEIFNNYWNDLRTWQQRKIFVLNHIKAISSTNQKTTRKSFNYFYYLPFNELKHMVCKNLFYSTLAIKEKTVLVWLKSKNIHN